MKQYRQGDLLIVEAKIPARAQPLQHRVLAHGEVTGHKHELDSGTLMGFGADVFLNLPDGARLNHEEHETIELPEGTYQVIRQREYDEKEIRYVQD